MTNKLKYFIGNWKMFGDFKSLKIAHQIHQFCKDYKNFNKKNRIILCIPNTLIFFFSSKLKSKFISFGAQNCHYHESYGSFTGSVNASMLKKVGAKFVILGHSENRLEGDTNKKIKIKIKSALDSKLRVIFCIGETLKEKNSDKTFLVLKKQITAAIKRNQDFTKIFIAYEPVWSIGTGKIPQINELKKIFKFIKIEVKKISKTRLSPLMLYGGSVDRNNIGKLSTISQIDGFLIGGASKSPKNFIDIIKNYYK